MLSKEDKEIRKRFHLRMAEFHDKEAGKHLDELVKLIREELDKPDPE